jgi:PBP1b-binding outer membrane lipoprotein LpoB
MNMKPLFAVFFVLVVLLIVAGCSQPAAPAPTPAPTSEAATMATTAAVTPTPAAISTPGPVDTLPDIWSIQVSVNSNGEAIDPQIIVALSGGKGINQVRAIDVTVTRSDGVVETQRMVQPLTMGQTVSLAGTTQNKDRCVVQVYPPTGNPVTIYDAYVPFRQYH